MYKGLFWIFILGGSVYFIADAIAGGDKFGKALTELTPEGFSNVKHDLLFVLTIIGGVMISDMMFGDKVTFMFLIIVLLGMLLSNSGKITAMLGRIGSQ